MVFKWNTPVNGGFFNMGIASFKNTIFLCSEIRTSKSTFLRIAAECSFTMGLINDLLGCFTLLKTLFWFLIIYYRSHENLEISIFQSAIENLEISDEQNLALSLRHLRLVPEVTQVTLRLPEMAKMQHLSGQ